MRVRNVSFYTTDQGRVPTEEALVGFERLSEELADAMGAAILELGDVESFAETRTVHVEDNLWCLYVYHKRKWAFMFFLVQANDSIALLNGYIKRATRLPELSKTQIRKAKYIIQEAEYA